MKLKDFGEKRLIKEIVVPLLKDNSIPVDIGDDAAVLDIGFTHDIVVSVDFVAEKLIALEKGLMNYYELGAYTATANLSDIASMGARPIALLLSMAMKEDLSIEEFTNFLRGAKARCEEFGVKIVGGDIGNATTNLFTGVALGLIEKGKHLTRSGFKNGDLVCTTGPIGLFSTALAYYLLPHKKQASEKAEQILKSSLVSPVPKVKQANLLTALNCCTACQDVTDGFSETIHEMTESSSFRFRIFHDRLPMHPVVFEVARIVGLDPIDVCFGPGAGFELVFTVKREWRKKIEDAFRIDGHPIFFIGEVVAGDRNVLISEKGEAAIIPRKFENFRGGDDKFIKKQLCRGENNE